MSTKCEVCNKNSFHGMGLAGNAARKRIKCLHCKRIMCPKCIKGAICKSCFSSAPQDIQKSCTKANLKGRLILWIVFVMLILPPIILYLTANSGTELGDTENAILMIIWGIGFFGICFAIIIMKSINKRWYKKNSQYIPPYGRNP